MKPGHPTASGAVKLTCRSKRDFRPVTELYRGAVCDRGMETTISLKTSSSRLFNIQLSPTHQLTPLL
ncbi:hypothetical protein EYF80_034094 [Liparis tanakae]|uniref:Uncharacterized protein n=1 Tax=Liparis tanakae TaxID=230148 RepID=A0A4Z2GQK8_9TELE|nr:hypothetical protein EYF80_034094 [Liparis tanakae]